MYAELSINVLFRRKFFKETFYNTKVFQGIKYYNVSSVTSIYRACADSFSVMNELVLAKTVQYKVSFYLHWNVLITQPHIASAFSDGGLIYTSEFPLAELIFKRAVIGCKSFLSHSCTSDILYTAVSTDLYIQKSGCIKTFFGWIYCVGLDVPVTWIDVSVPPLARHYPLDNMD